MLRANVKNIDYWTYIFGVSALMVFFVFINMELIFTLCKSAEEELSRYIRGFSVVVVPLYSMFACAVAFTVLSSFFFKKIIPLDGVIPSLIVAASFVVLGVLDDMPIWAYALGAVVGVFAWYYVVRFLSIFLEGIPAILDSQNWSENSLEYKHSAPRYWVWAMNISFVLSVLSFPVFFVYSLDLPHATWAFSVLAASAFTSVGLFYLKREQKRGYFFHLLALACAALLLASPEAMSTLTAGWELMMEPIAMLGFMATAVVLAALANCGRMIGRAFDE